MKSNWKIPLCYFQTGVLGSRPPKGFFVKLVAVCGTDMKIGCQGQVDTLKKTRCGNCKIVNVSCSIFRLGY